MDTWKILANLVRDGLSKDVPKEIWDQRLKVLKLYSEWRAENREENQ